MRIGIVGCGYVGCRLAARLRAAGYDVWGTARSATSLAAICRAGAEPRALDLSDLTALGRALADAEAIIWLAPPTDPAPLGAPPAAPQQPQVALSMSTPTDLQAPQAALSVSPSTDLQAPRAASPVSPSSARLGPQGAVPRSPATAPAPPGASDLLGPPAAVPGAGSTDRRVPRTTVAGTPPTGPAGAWGAAVDASTALPARLAAAVKAAAPGRLVYASTSAVYRRPTVPDAWVDEASPVGPSGPRGQARLAQERAFLAALPETRVVRIAGIYGPGRTLEPRLRAGQAFAPVGADCGQVSRVHVDDLCRILQAALHPQAPALVNACDGHPAPTLEVARFTAALVGLPPPKTDPDAACHGGSRLRSRYLEAWIGPLRYPSYREGLAAALAGSPPGVGGPPGR